MITKTTTLVLGAGASMPYGFPSGAELRSLICGPTQSRPSHAGAILEQYHLAHERDVREFADTFLRSGVASIDAFLAKRDNLTEIGKYLIAYTLCERENDLTIFRTDIEDHWYHYLWQELINDAHTAEDILKNEIRFVIFNYDRSLEFFLHQAIMHTFGRDAKSALAILKKMDILHVYGSIGEYNYTTTLDTRVYTRDMTRATLLTAANSIKVIPEAREHGKEFQIAQGWFYDSKIIGFLGFGFDRLNVHRLNLSSMIEQKIDAKNTSPKIISSTFGKTRAEIENISMLLWPRFPQNINSFTLNNTQTLRESNLLHLGTFA